MELIVDFLPLLFAYTSLMVSKLMNPFSQLHITNLRIMLVSFERREMYKAVLHSENVSSSDEL